MNLSFSNDGYTDPDSSARENPVVLWWNGCMVQVMDLQEFPAIRIENIVASGAVADSIDLAELAGKTDHCELNTKRFPGAVFRLENPKIASLIFASGKIVLTGMKDEQALQTGLKAIMEALSKAGVQTYEHPRVAITNIVCSCDTGKSINLNKLVITFNLENIEYEPEQFPGLVYRLSDPKIVALLFSSGKIILTGGKNLDDVRKGLHMLEQKLATVS
jgi:transcription initiation factor TFIID TATA-box-binding protein